MKVARRTRHARIAEADATQLTLGIDAPGAPEVRWSRLLTDAPAAPELSVCLEPIVMMKDVCRLAHRHRSTIYRWMKRKRFPPMDAPRSQPIGWLRSTVIYWQLGPLPRD
jgi:predicted DNA-binding transcriptional regulator AlpA